MKNKKGFTLIELLAVLALLALIMTIAFPNFTDLSNKAKSKYDRSTLVLIESAAKMYVNNNVQEVDRKIAASSNGKYCIEVGKLIAYEYLDKEDIEGSKGTTKIEDKTCMNVKKIDGAYDYELGGNTTSTDYLPPVITIKNRENKQGCEKIITNKSISSYDNDCIIEVKDNVSGQTQFMSIKESPNNNENIRNQTRNLKLEKTVTQIDNKIFIDYNATDAAGNKAIPLQVQLILP